VYVNFLRIRFLQEWVRDDLKWMCVLARCVVLPQGLLQPTFGKYTLYGLVECTCTRKSVMPGLLTLWINDPTVIHSLLIISLESLSASALLTEARVSPSWLGQYCLPLAVLPEALCMFWSSHAYSGW